MSNETIPTFKKQTAAFQRNINAMKNSYKEVKQKLVDRIANSWNDLLKTSCNSPPFLQIDTIFPSLVLLEFESHLLVSGYFYEEIVND